MLGQDNSEAIMRAHLAKLGVHVESGIRLQDFEQHDDRVLARVLKNSDAGQAETVTCRWLVGTDGARGML